jgi:hypothetical protein
MTEHQSSLASRLRKLATILFYSTCRYVPRNSLQPGQQTRTSGRTKHASSTIEHLTDLKRARLFRFNYPTNIPDDRRKLINPRTSISIYFPGTKPHDVNSIRTFGSPADDDLQVGSASTSHERISRPVPHHLDSGPKLRNRSSATVLLKAISSCRRSTSSTLQASSAGACHHLQQIPAIDRLLDPKQLT